MRNRNLDISKLQVAAFDWDNTLALTHETLVYSIEKVLADFGLEKWDTVRQKFNPQLSFADNFPAFFGAKAKDAYQQYCATYVQNMRRYTKLPPDAEKILHLFKQHNVRIAVVTNKTRNLLEAELSLLYDKSLFDRLVCGHEALKNKPYPEPLQQAVSGLADEITPQTVWMTGDSATDSKCALAAGAQAIQLEQSLWKETALNDDRIIYVRDFAQLYDFLAG